MTVSLSPEAIAGLDEIGDWNAGNYTPDHARRYIAFLRETKGSGVIDYKSHQTLPAPLNFPVNTVTSFKKTFARLLIDQVFISLRLRIVPGASLIP
jgi:hypothetical protein